jgi:hypothetical protein
LRWADDTLGSASSRDVFDSFGVLVVVDSISPVEVGLATGSSSTADRAAEGSRLRGPI